MMEVVIDPIVFEPSQHWCQVSMAMPKKFAKEIQCSFFYFSIMEISF